MASLSLKIIYCTFAPLPNRIPFIAICALLWRKKKLIWLLGILCFGKTVGCIQWTQTQREMLYLGRLKKWQLVQHCYAGAAELVGPFPLVMLYDSTIHRVPLSQRVPKVSFVVSRMGSTVRKPCFLPMPYLVPSLLGVTKLTRMKIFLWKATSFSELGSRSLPSNSWTSFIARLFARGTKRTLCPWTSSSLPLAL